MNHLTLRRWPALLTLAASGAFSVEAAAADARALRQVGPGPVQVNGQPLDAARPVPEKARITTPAGTQLFLEVMPGVVAVVAANSEITLDRIAAPPVFNAAVTLQRGSLATVIDNTATPPRLFQISTPGQHRIVARGTTYTVIVGGTTYTVVTSAGRVEVTPRGGSPVQVTAGGVSVNGAAPVALSSLAGGSAQAAAAREAVSVALAAVASVAGDAPAFGDGAAAGARGELAEAVDTLVRGGAPAEFVQQALRTADGAAPSQAGTLALAALKAPGGEAALAGILTAVAQGAVAASPTSAEAVTQQLMAAARSALPGERFAAAGESVAKAVLGGVIVALVGPGTLGRAIDPQLPYDPAVQIASATKAAVASLESARPGLGRGMSIVGDLIDVATAGITDPRLQVAISQRVMHSIRGAMLPEGSAGNAMATNPSLPGTGTNVNAVNVIEPSIVTPLIPTSPITIINVSPSN